MRIKQQAISGVKWSGISMGAISGLQLVTLTVLARLLSPADFGLMGMIMVVIGFAGSFADMGISNAIIHRQDTTREQLSSLYWLNIFAGVIVFCIVCASNPLIVKFYREPRLIKLLYLTAIIFLITPIGQQFQIILQKELRFNRLVKIEIVSALINSLVAIASAFAGLGVFSLIWGQLASASAKVIMLLGVGWQQWRPSFHFAKCDLKGYLSFGIYQMGERTINYLNSNFDYLLIGSTLGASALGYYTLAYNLILKPTSLINPVITKVAFPVFSLIQNEKEKLRIGYLKILKLLSTIIFPMMVGLAVVAPLVVSIIFGEQWLQSIILIQILTIVGLFRSVGNPVGSLLLAKGRADLGFKWNLGWCLIQMPGLYIGAKLGGVVGVAIAYSIIVIFGSILNYLILIRNLIGQCLRDYIRSMWPALWISVIMGILVLLLGVIFGPRSHRSILIIQILFGVLIYIGLMVYNQKSFLIEIMNMIFNKENAVV